MIDKEEREREQSRVRQKRMRDRRAREGLSKVEVWVPADKVDQIKALEKKLKPRPKRD